MKELLVIIISIFVFSCNSKNNENIVYDNSEKNLIDYENLKIKNSEAKKTFIDGLKNVENIEYENAYSKFIEANKIEPNNVLILNGLANVENLQGKKLEAEKKFKEAIKIDSLYIPSYVNYGKLLHEQTKYSDADKILKIF